jgi:hypothetical protein
VVVVDEIRATAAHPFYQCLNELLDEHGFDRFVEGECKQVDILGNREPVEVNL